MELAKRNGICTDSSQDGIYGPGYCINLYGLSRLYAIYILQNMHECSLFL